MENKEENRMRCAIYTRKSTKDGLDQEFTSVDAQREAAESYIQSQKEQGWVCLPDRYDDGGYTGGNMERPALTRLMNDIRERRVDCVVVYKVDRLSRSLLDFAKMIELFEKRSISFVSVTQQFNTANSLGRLTLNILLSFAQFERELISERTRDKIAATRRKGKWSGGIPILGYDIDREAKKLIVNEKEAQQVRDIFDMYLQQESLLETVRQLKEKGYTTKQWITRKGKEKGGRSFSKNTLYNLLKNLIYTGKITYKEEVHEGEHEAIVGTEVFLEVQKLLKRNGSGFVHPRRKSSSLLNGLLKCGPCGCAMTHTYSKKKNKRYCYYVCLRATKEGWDKCPSPSVPARQIEEYVVDQIRCIGRDPELIVETAREVRKQAAARIRKLETEKKRHSHELKQQYAAVNSLLAQGDQNGDGAEELISVQECIDSIERRITDIEEEMLKLGDNVMEEQEIRKTCGSFDPLWDVLTTRERSRILNLLIESIEYDGEKKTVSITYKPTCITSLSQELQKREVE